MYSLELSSSLSTKLIKFFVRRKAKKKTKQQKPITYETFNEYKGDVMDYDGMGNYGRFPCSSK